MIALHDAAQWIAGYLAIGAAVGFFAGMLGIGGGALMIPLLVWLFEAQGLPREHLLRRSGPWSRTACRPGSCAESSRC